jgi:hypothetical protein
VDPCRFHGTKDATSGRPKKGSAVFDLTDPARYVGGTAVLHRPVERAELAAAEADLAGMANLLIALLEQRKDQFITDAERNRLKDRMDALTMARAAAYPEATDD